MRRSLLSGALAMLSIFAAVPAWACPLCLGGLAFAPGQQLDVADQAVLAAPAAGGTRWRVLQVVKGAVPVGPLIAGPVQGADKAVARTGRPSLLLHHALWPQWFHAGTIGAEYAGWLRRLAAAGPGTDREEVDWPGRVALVTPYLEDAEPLAAAFAYGEIARAPYGALRSLKPRLDPATIARWLDDPKLAARRPAYTLLLGIAGGPLAAERLAQRLEAAWASRDATNLGAMLAADLEVRGPARVVWIETMYLADRHRTMPEIAAAVRALGEHGDDDGRVPRARVIQAYLLLIKERKPLAGLVAERLAKWEYWAAVTDYAEILGSAVRLDPASRGEIVAYLERCPRAEARAALAALPGAPESATRGPRSTRAPKPEVASSPR